MPTDQLLGTQGWRRFALFDPQRFVSDHGDQAFRALAQRQPQAVLQAQAGGFDDDFGVLGAPPPEVASAAVPHGEPAAPMERMAPRAAMRPAPAPAAPRPAAAPRPGKGVVAKAPAPAPSIVVRPPQAQPPPPPRPAKEMAKREAPPARAEGK